MFIDLNKDLDNKQETNENVINDYLSTVLFTISQMHIFHWYTTNGQEHQAIGEFYTGLETELDNFAERFIGKNGLSVSSNQQTLFFNYNREALLGLVDNLNTETNKIIESLNTTDNLSIIDALVDIKELIDTLKYKLRLS